MSTKPTDKLLDHEYDGIREFDNPIPAWWTWLWIGSIVFSAVYFVHYHVAGTGEGIFAAYEVEMEEVRAIEAEQRKAMLANLSEDTLLMLMKDETALAAGKKKYEEVCLACHAAQGQGLVGPNLTDAYWIHADGSLMSIREIVANGVAEKGMPAWEKMMSSELLTQVVAYVGTFRGTNVEGKEPQGKEVAGEYATTN